MIGALVHLGGNAPVVGIAPRGLPNPRLRGKGQALATVGEQKLRTYLHHRVLMFRRGATARPTERQRYDLYAINWPGG
jgi:hypothetical protein